MPNSTSSTTSCTVGSGTSSTVTVVPALDIKEFVFRYPPNPLPSGSEANKRTKYAGGTECKSAEKIDRRLRDRIVITFNAVNTNNDVKYKLFIVKEDNSNVEVTFDSSNSESSLTFFNDEEFHAMTNPEGQHYWTIWGLKYKGCEKLDLIPVGKYKCKIVTKDKNGNEKDWYSKNSIEIIGDPFKITIICSPMTNSEIENEKKDGHYISDNGNRIGTDCYLKVFRGEYPSSSICVGTFKAMMMPCGTDQGKNIATPKGTYFGYKDSHNGEYDVVELESNKTDSGDGKVLLPVGCINHPPAGNYKKQVQIHKNPNTSGWTSSGLSYGCIVVPEANFGAFGNPFKNRQNNSGSTTPHDNSDDLSAAIFGGYDSPVIPVKSNHKRKLDIQIKLESPTGADYSVYRRIYNDIIQEVKIELNGTNVDLSFRVPNGVFRNYQGGERHFAIDGNTKFRWYVAKYASDGKIIALRRIMGETDFVNLQSKEYTWTWDGYDKAPGEPDRKREAGVYLCVIETKFDNGLAGVDNIKENNVLGGDGQIGSAWNYNITIS